MYMTVTCPACGKVGKCSDRALGQKARCKNCMTIFQVGEKPQTPPTVSETPDQSTSSPDNTTQGQDDIPRLVAMVAVTLMFAPFPAFFLCLWVIHPGTGNTGRGPIQEESEFFLPTGAGSGSTYITHGVLGELYFYCLDRSWYSAIQ